MLCFNSLNKSTDLEVNTPSVSLKRATASSVERSCAPLIIFIGFLSDFFTVNTTSEEKSSP